MRSDARLFTAIEALLSESPLPWTWQMLADWFGYEFGKNVHYAEPFGIRRLERGLYTSAKHVPDGIQPRIVKRRRRVVTVSSALMESRFGIRC